MSPKRPEYRSESPTEPPRPQTSLIKRLRSSAHPSAMLERISLLTRLFVKTVFGSIRFETRCLDKIRKAHSEATIVYALRSRSLIDYLFFNVALLHYEFPLARFANGLSTSVFRPLLSKLARLLTCPLRLFRHPFPSKPETFQAAVQAGESTLVFLERASLDEFRNREFSLPYLTRLIDLAQTQEARPIQILPLLLVWEKRPDPYEKTLVDEVFGSRSSPGPIRKFIYLFQSVWQSLIRAGSPTVQVASALDLEAFIRESDLLNRREKAQLLLDRLLDVFTRERQVIVGPPLKRPATIAKEVLNSSPVDKAIAHITHSKPEYPSVVKKQARKIIKEIAANYNLITIKFLSTSLNPIFETLYQGFEIDAEGLDRVRELATKRRIVVVPSHKSHMDYLILSNVFYQHGLMPPHIAAGVNLSFWPLGPLFRRAGAFFLRRSFRGDRLYSAIFSQYLITLLKEGFPVEFFIEGTRSRTGKLCRPRYGMLSMILQGVLSERLKDVTFVPISVGYEKIIEGKSYTQETLGGEKQAENISGVLRAGRFLRTKHGRLYVEFEDPIDLDEIIEKHELTDDSSREERMEALRELADEIIRRINKATTVTPSAVVATALLNSTETALHLNTLLSHIGFLVNLLAAKGARLSNTIRGALTIYRAAVSSRSLNRQTPYSQTSRLAAPAASHRHPQGETEPTALPYWEVGRALRDVVHETLGLFAQNDWIKVKRQTDAQAFAIDEDHRPDLAYLRNNIIHFFVPDMILAASLAVNPNQEIPEEELIDQSKNLNQIFQFEFGLGSEEQFVDSLMHSLVRFVEYGWVNQQLPGDRIRKPPSLPLPVQYCGRLLMTWLESYWIVGEGLGALIEEPMEARDFLKLCLKQGKRYDYVHLESLNKPTFNAALDWYQQRGIVETVEDETERRKANRLIRIRESHREADRWREIPLQLMSYLQSMQGFLIPCVAFEETSFEDEDFMAENGDPSRNDDTAPAVTQIDETS